MVYFFRQVVGIRVVEKTVLSQRTGECQKWVEAYARNHALTLEWAEKGVRKEDYVLPHLRRMVKNNAYEPETNPARHPHDRYIGSVEAARARLVNWYRRVLGVKKSVPAS